MGIVAIVLCFLGVWQLCKWSADIVIWAFDSPTYGDLFRCEMNSMPRQKTIEELLDELEQKAKENGVSIMIDLSNGSPHDRYKPSSN